MQSNPTPSLSQIVCAAQPSTPVHVRLGKATLGQHALPEQDALKLAALASQYQLTASQVADLLVTGVYHRLVLHTRKMGPVTTHTIGLRAADRSAIPMARLWSEVKAVHQDRMKQHGTQTPVRILDVGGRIVAQLEGGKRFPVANLVRNRLAIGGTYPAYIHTFQANGRAMHIAVPQPDEEIHVELKQRLNLPRSLAGQVKSRAKELHFQDQLTTLTQGGKIELGNFALQA